MTDVQDWIMIGGVAGAALLLFLERFVPIAPSWAVLVSLGVASAHGLVDPLAAFVASVAGSTGSALLWYLLGASTARGTGRLSVAGTNRWLDLRTYPTSQTVFSPHRIGPAMIVAQCVPMVRLVAPALAGAAGVRPQAIVLPVALGCAVWNGTFIALGWFFGA